MKWEVKISILLVIFSIFFYLINYLTFHDTIFIEKYILVQLGFLPLSVLLVTIVLNSLMVRKERRERMEKLNIVIGSFFADLGKDLLRYISKYDQNVMELANGIISLKNDPESFHKLKNIVEKRKYSVDFEKINLYELRKYLLDKRDIVISFLDNPVIIEHETFTDLLWVLLHVTEELSRTIDFESMGKDDRKDLKEDMEELYRLLAYEWIKYVHYLRDNYPHIYKYEIRSNPFVPHAYHARSAD